MGSIANSYNTRGDTDKDGRTPANGNATPLMPAGPMSRAAQAFYERNTELRDIPPHILRQAWFNMAHLILSDGSRVAHMGCGAGHVTYAMAKLYPEYQFLGIGSDKKAVTKARLMFQLPNLSFEHGSVSGDNSQQKESFDGIVNSFALHEIYSSARYNEQQVIRALEHQFSLLKPEGLMLIRDYALRLPGEYVLMEIPDDPNSGEDIETMSEADLLVWYAENAHPEQEPGCKGFFLEELPPRFPQTRIFRLSYKWAYEFIIRKDNRARFKDDLHKEYAFFTERDFRKNLRSLGARALYTAPLWDETYIKEYFENRFRILREDGKSPGLPPTSFVIVAQKQGEKGSLRLLEKRPSGKPDNRLRISAVRNEKTGRIVDIVTRDIQVTDVIPYRITPEGKLKVFIHEAVPRSIINAVSRKGRDLDGKRWSGHMVEAIGVSSDVIHTIGKEDYKAIAKFARDYLGLQPTIKSFFQRGPSSYPAPDFIDDVVETRYLRVRKHSGAIIPKIVMEDLSGFTSLGRIREVDAQQILDAISVGLIPNARLEMQILNLFEKLKIKAQTWETCPLVLEEAEPELMFNGPVFAKLKTEKDNRFKPVRGSGNQLRAVNSVFVDEGWKNGSPAGIASCDMGFVISEENTINKAVILPLSKQAGEVMVGFETLYMPGPQRIEGNGLQLKAPSVNLPNNIKNMQEARRYIADLFKVPVENVWKLGERFFCHAGVTPIRIYPFAVATNGKKENPLGGPIQFAPMHYIWVIIDMILGWRHDEVFVATILKTYRRFGMDNDLHLKHAMGKAMLAHKAATTILETTNIDGMETREAATEGKAEKAERATRSLPETKERITTDDKDFRVT